MFEIGGIHIFKDEKEYPYIYFKGQGSWDLTQIHILEVMFLYQKYTYEPCYENMFVRDFENS